MIAQAKAIEREDKGRAWLAWHIEAMARQKTLPDLSRLMGVPPKAQTEDELWDAVTSWVASHNAKVARQELFGG